jgi:hypothetical protein
VQLASEGVQVDTARRQDATRLGLVGNRQQQVLESDGVVPALGRQPE